MGVAPQQQAVVPPPPPPQQQSATMPHQCVQPPVRVGAGNRAHRDSRRSGWGIRKPTALDLQRSSEATVRAGRRIARHFLQHYLQGGHQGATVIDDDTSSEDSSIEDAGSGESSNEDLSNEDPSNEGPSTEEPRNDEPSGDREDEGGALMNKHAFTGNGSTQYHCWICDHPYKILERLYDHVRARTTHCCIVEKFDTSKDADNVYVVNLPDNALAAWPRRAFYGADGVRTAALRWDIRGSRGLIQEIQPGHFLIFTQKQSDASNQAQHSTMRPEQLPDVWAPFALHGMRIPALPQPAPIDGLIVTQSAWKGLDRLKAPDTFKVRDTKALLWEMCPKTVSNLKEQLRYNKSLEKAGQEVDERLLPVDDNKGDDKVDDEADTGNDGLV
ncbi:hypothetical protein KC360_g7890 [Hortaea werneckii]|nr:hypothetical protein KC361_g8190 [Hortaea werneckii]KAI6879572.1 hypothetical protein KC325_g7881 [Hortaea werneckii]KAI6987595.1 hypothetical protein KC359_g8203 [Hortaea werneckii]KAI7141680.1 hypothetical protein KC344_g7809 [Hortaea werneckii]KAI7168754.1 hypothetical protein KC360_g7890 [Hortaea werneckii]